jgi:hypothetical protein
MSQFLGTKLTSAAMLADVCFQGQSGRSKRHARPKSFPLCPKPRCGERSCFGLARIDNEERLPMLIGPLMRAPRPYGD